MSEADDKFASDAVKRKVNMKKFLIFVLLFLNVMGISAQGVYQFKDPGFESWTSKNVVGNGWNSFETAERNGLDESLFNMGKGLSPKPVNVEGHLSKSALKLKSKNLFGAKANGNITTGVIMMGDSDPVKDYQGERKNFNKTCRSKEGQYLLFKGRPDKVSFYAKFKSGGSPNARGRFILHGDVDYRDPDLKSDGTYFPDMKENLIGEASILVPATGAWTYFEQSFTYYKNQPVKQYLLASLTTNPQPGGSSGDELCVDDVLFIYYHALSDLKYNGKTIEGFSESKLDYNLSTLVYDASKVDWTQKGVGATVKKNYNKETGVLSITVKGNDFSENPASVTTYTVQFAKQADKAVEYTNGLSVNVNEEVTPPQLTTYSVVTKADKSISLVLKNFMLGSGEDAIPVGNIVLDNVTVKGNHYTTNKVILISAGDDPNYSEEDWYGPILGEVPVKLDGTLHDGRLDATIDIDMFATLKQVIKVVLAPLYEATPAKALTIPADGLGNVTFNRTFYKGWNTFVAPFPVTKKQLGFEKVNALAAISTSAGWLKFDDVADETLEANKPYLLYYSADKTSKEFYYGGEVLSTTGDVKATVTGQGGAKVNMVGNYTPKFSVEGNYLLTDHTGEDEIAKAGARSTVDATKCYFTFENVADPAALFVKFGGDVTGMGNVVAEETAPRANGVYNLQGVKLSNGSVEGLPAGLYIVNGRKVLVK